MLNIGYADFSKIKGIKFQNFEKIDTEFKKVKGISTDSRTIKKGEVFWALIGDNFDGHLFLKGAADKPALFAVVKSTSAGAYDSDKMPLAIVPDTLLALQELAKIQRQKFDIPIIAVTGSNGKTTVKEMIAHVLDQKKEIHKTKGNFNNHIGCPLTLLELKKKHEAAVIELGTNHPGEIAILTKIAQPNQAVVTDISGAHLEHFDTVDNIAREKLSLFDSLPDKGVIYKNLDNPFIEAYKSSNLRTISYSMKNKADVTGRLNSIDENGCAKFILNENNNVHLQVSGIHNVKNALAAAAVGINFGLTENEIKDALESYQAYSKRMQFLKWRGIKIINDAYNANPNSMFAAFETINAMQEKGRVFLILGDMFELGDSSIQLHIEVLTKALDLDPEAIWLMGKHMKDASQALKGSLKKKFLLFEDHDQLATEMRNQLQEGDLVLIKGSRGMTMENVLQLLD